MKITGGIIVAAALVLASGSGAEALRKCPQADGSVVSVPESATCEFEPPKTPASIRADKQRRMAEACDLLWGPASQHTPMWLIPEKVRATGFAPSWGQCDELQRMQVR